MFQKHQSSIVNSSDGSSKKAKDVTVRRSDRRRLRQTALESLQVGCSTTDQQEQEPLQRLLHHAWEQGSLVQRTLHVANGGGGGVVHLWFRSPEPHNDDQKNPDDHAVGCWPYTCASQCIWLQVPAEPTTTGVNSRSTSSVAQRPYHQVPGLALLAVLLNHHQAAEEEGWQFPNIVQIHSQVTSYICRGAHVMRAGMLHMALQQPSSAVVAVCARGNPQPLAVGILHPDLRNIHNKNAANIGPGTQGIGVTIVHCYGDDLWKQQLAGSGGSSSRAGAILNRVGGAPYDDGHYGNVGFVDGKHVVPIDIPGDEPSPPPPVVFETSDETRTNANSIAVSDTVVDGSATEVGSPPSVALETSITEANTTADESDTADVSGTTTTMSPEAILHAAVCRALVQLHTKNDLPMTMATFYAHHVLPNQPANTPKIQLKQTRYKKWHVYVTEQTQAGLLLVGADPKNTQDPLLTGYNRTHDDLRPYLQEQQYSTAADTTGGTPTARRLVMVNLYAIPHHWVLPLRLDRDTVQAAHATSLERRGTGLLTLPEVRQIVQDYIVREELVRDKPANVVSLDGPLTDVLYSCKKKQNKKGSADESSSTVPPPANLSHSDLMKQFQAGLEPAYALVQMPGNAILRLGRGAPPQVTIEVTRRQSNKFVTTVRGLEVFGVDPAALAKDVGQRFACASSVVPPPPRTSGGGGATTQVQFQGNLANELEALLLGDESLTNHGGAKGSTYHLPKNSITVVLRKGVPARKKTRGGASKATKS